jgi:hypothetical protein
MKRIFILLLVIALFAGCQREQLLQPIDKVDEGLVKLFLSKPKQPQPQANIGIVQSILSYGFVFSTVICVHALKTNNPNLMMRGFYLMAGCVVMSVLGHRH